MTFIEFLIEQDELMVTRDIQDPQGSLRQTRTAGRRGEVKTARDELAKAQAADKLATELDEPETASEKRLRRSRLMTARDQLRVARERERADRQQGM